MRRAIQFPNRAAEVQLERVVEPLASYIVAANRPRAALLSALAVLYRALEENNRAANAYVAALTQNR
jgi:hypothetical protein